MINTKRLELVPSTVASLRAELEGMEEFSTILEARVPASWPPELYDRAAAEYTLAKLSEGAHQDGWWLHYVVLEESALSSRTVIGTCGCKGPPADGMVEIGYGILPEYRRNGYATEAANGLIAHAFSRSDVAFVIAETLPELAPSIGVLQKLGFRFIGEGSEKGVVRYELQRGDYSSRVMEEQGL